MSPDSSDLSADARKTSVKTFVDFLKQRRALPGILETYSTTALEELDTAVETGDKAVTSAKPAARARKLLEMTFLVAGRRDLRYGVLGSRRQLMAHAYNEAMLRNYFAGRTSVLYPA